MYRDLCQLGLVCACVASAHAAIAQAIPQSITFSPAVPTSAHTVVATLSQPFNCAASAPSLTASSADSVTLDSSLPDPSAIVNCAFVPIPPPTISNFPITLGALPPGTYRVTWNIYQNQATGPALLRSSKSASVVVAPGADGRAITAGFTGNWFDPDQSGHGFSIEVLPGNLMLAEWFVFDPDGAQKWIIATGPITGNTAVLQGYYPVGSGGRFPPSFDPAQLQNTPWGTLVFTFSDCNHGQVSWQPTVEGYSSGSLPIARLTMPAGLTCP
jgi:hypothetical protein